MTYHLLSTPSAYRKLRDEIRGRYPGGAAASSEVDATSAQALPYLQAVIAEGLRIYPPGSQGFPRKTPAGEGIEVDGRYVPGGVSNLLSSFLSFFSHQDIFRDPLLLLPWTPG